MLRRSSREINSRLPARFVPHFNVPPSHAAPPSRAERLHGRLFRSKSRRIALKFRLVPLAIPNFLRAVHAFNERVPKAPNRSFDAVNFRNVRAGPYDHSLPRIPNPRSRVHYNGKRYRFRAAVPNAATKSKSAPRRQAAQKAASPWRLRKSQGPQILELLPFTKFDWLVHGFSTRPGGVSVIDARQNGRARDEKVLNLGYTDWDRRERVDENRRRFVKTLGHSELPLVTLCQIHSDISHVISAPPVEPPKGDALATAAPGLLLAIQTADCIPILLVDPRHRALAAIHAGWRGTLARIAAKTLGCMQMEFSTKPADVLAAIGPGIGRCCYEVGPDVVKEFASQFSQARSWFDGPFDALASGEDPNPLPWLTMMPPGHQPPPPRCHLDLKAANTAILIETGVSPQNIFTSDLCTSCRTDLFFSYRREHLTGRMLSAVAIT
jgi:polyphenol oxidase